MRLSQARRTREAVLLAPALPREWIHFPDLRRAPRSPRVRSALASCPRPRAGGCVVCGVTAEVYEPVLSHSASL